MEPEDIIEHTRQMILKHPEKFDLANITDKYWHALNMNHEKLVRKQLAIDADRMRTEI